MIGSILRLAALGTLMLAFAACGPKKPAQDADDMSEDEMEELDEVEQEGMPAEAMPSDDVDQAGKKPKRTGDPVFEENMTVDQAINAAAGTDTINIDQDALGVPLRDEKTYAACKLKPSDHFTVRVAIWNGRAVGMDLTTTPPNKPLESCIRQQIKDLTWKDKVKSLNIVEYQM